MRKVKFDYLQFESGAKAITPEKIFQRVNDTERAASEGKTNANRK